MTRDEVIGFKKNAQKIRRNALKSLLNETNNERETEMLMAILGLAHEQISQASLNLDLMDLRSNLSRRIHSL